MRKKSLIILGLLALVAVAATLLWAAPSFAGKLEDAIAQTPQGTGPGMIHPEAAKGFLGIPGAPKPFLVFWHLMGYLGGLDLLHRGRLRRHHGRRGPYQRLRPG